MKKLVYLFIVIISLTFTSCTNNDTSSNLECVYSNSPSFSYQFTFAIEELEKLIPNEYNDYDNFRFMCLNNNIAYFATVTGTDIWQSKNIFSYDLKTMTFEHIADVSNLNVLVKQVLKVKNDIYLYSESASGHTIHLYKNNDFTLLSKDIITPMVEYADGIGFVEPINNIFVSYDGQNKNIMKSKYPLGSLVDRDEITCFTQFYNDFWIIILESNKKYEVSSSHPYLLDHVFIIEKETESGLDLLSIYNYDNKKIGYFEDHNITVFRTNNNDTIFYTNLYNELHQCTIDLTGQSINISKLDMNYYVDYPYYDIFSDDNYMIYSYSIKNTSDYIFDVYLKE